MKIFIFFFASAMFVSAQRITTIQLDGIQYFISRMNPYSPELNYFLAYQYCRSLGLQLVSFETKEKADNMIQYLKNAGYTKYDFWTSGNNLGTDMFLWMSTGLPFNTTFNYLLSSVGKKYVDGKNPLGTEPQRLARESIHDGTYEGCVGMISPSLNWNTMDCTLVKDFICEQTRCYYYNYGSIPVSATQGNHRSFIADTTVTSKITSTVTKTKIPSKFKIFEYNHDNSPFIFAQDLAGVPISSEKILSHFQLDEIYNKNPIFKKLTIQNFKKNHRIHLSHITHKIRSTEQKSATANQNLFGQQEQAIGSTSNIFDDTYTIGPYDNSYLDYQADQSEVILSKTQQKLSQKNPDDTSTVLPEDEPSYRYNIKVRNSGKVLDPLFN